MDSKRIEALLQKYWNCESSLEEEEELRTYFSCHDVPEQWKETAALFRYFGEHKEKTLSDPSFDAGVLHQVKEPAANKIRRLVYNTMRIAAGLAVLVMAVWFVHRELAEPTTQTAATDNAVPAEEDTYQDPKLAFEETKKALMMISKSFGKAEEQAKNINLFNEAKEEIQQQDTQTPSPKKKT